MAKHPILPETWSNTYRDLAKLGGAGDCAGVPPTPFVAEFLRLFYEKQGLFTQEDYLQFCINRWKDTDWYKNIKTDLGLNGIKAKTYRNFYPSMVSTLHVAAFLHMSGVLNSILYDVNRDAIGKSDLTVIDKNGNEKRFALFIGSPAGNLYNLYKDKHRTPPEVGIIKKELTMNRPREPGNMRWYSPKDFYPEFPELSQTDIVARVDYGQMEIESYLNVRIFR